MIRRISFISISVILLSLVQTAHSQNLPPVGQWRDHLPYNEAIAIAETKDKVFCASPYALFSYDKEDFFIEKLSRVQGLTEASISNLAYAPEKDILIVGYLNANIDLIQGRKITNIPEIKTKTNLINKVIHSIKVYEDLVYFACGFGIVVYDLERKEFRDTYFLGESGTQSPVFDVVLDHTFIYATTNTGVLRAERDNPNLVNFNNWSLVPGLETGSYTSGTYFGGRLFFIRKGVEVNSDQILYYENDVWKELWEDFNTEFYALDTENDYLTISRRAWVTTFDQNLNVQINVRVANPQHALYSENQQLYVADSREGLLVFDADENSELIAPPGPADINVFDLTYHMGNIYAVAGGYNAQYTQTYTWAGVYRFSENGWESHVTDSIRDLIRIAGVPNDPQHVYAASWGYGLVEYENLSVVDRFYSANSPIESVIPGSEYHRVQGMAFDNDRNLWVTLSGSTVENALLVKTPEDEWTAFDVRGKMSGAAYGGDMVITPRGDKWITLPRGNGMFVFTENGTIGDESDDQYRYFTISDDKDQDLSSDVYSIAQDHDNNIWIGTANGPVVYYNPNNVFEEEGFYASQILIAQNDTSNFASVLLENQIVTSIEIDGANRKWFGTRGSGAFLIAEDGREEVLRFSKENSPLPSNNIIDITIHEETGEVFFATDMGIYSYRGIATEGDDYFSNVYVFPNPVRPEYSGDIVITGLIENTNVKITDISGNLAYETTSFGGQAIWDGRNFGGRRVQTGVYLVFCTTPDGSQTHIAKLLFIN